MVVSGTLHTYPWQSHRWFELFRKLDFVTIFVAIASFYSSLGKILFCPDSGGSGSERQPDERGRGARGGGRLFFVIEGTVWACAAVGGLLKWRFPDVPRYVNASVFLVQGWACLPLFPRLLRS